MALVVIIFCKIDNSKKEKNPYEEEEVPRSASAIVYSSRDV